MGAMSPKVHAAYGADIDHAIMCDAPMLCTLDAAYGDGSAVLWLMKHLFALGEYAGVRDKMDDWQTEELAKIIRTEYGNLKTSEMCLFFYRYKVGRYGQFYGGVDPIRITQGLSKYCEERCRILAKQDAEQRNAERAAHRECTITYQQYLELKRKEAEQ